MKLKSIETFQILILICLCIITAVFFFLKISFNILAITIAIGALMYAVAIVIEGGIDQRDMRKVNYISPREKDENLLQDMEDVLNKLYKENKIVDNIQIANATGYDDNRKEVYIIYH